MINNAYILETLTKLVQINSINPSLEEAGRGELEIATYIDSQLRSLGIDSKIEMLSPGRVNVVGVVKGNGSGKNLLLNAHMDTVGVKGMQDPFSAEVKNGKLYGRGAYDMKASIASMLAAAKAINESGIQVKGDVIFTFVADEEFDSIGSEDIVKKYKADACIVTEPTELQVCLGHRGFGVYEIKTKGKVAHGGRHQEGIDANMKMGSVLAELNKLSANLINQKPHPLFGQASLHVPLIHGGQSLFIYSGECTLKVERRTLPGEKESIVLQQFQDILNKLSSEDEGFKGSVKQLMWRNPHEIAHTSEIVKVLHQSVVKVEGRDTGYIGHTWWEDSGLFGEAGMQTVIIGPTGGGIHQEVEWVELKSVSSLAQILVDTVSTYCN